jgi:hypothetical protein
MKKLLFFILGLLAAQVVALVIYDAYEYLYSRYGVLPMRKK